MKIGIKAIEYYLPDRVLTNKELVATLYPQWEANKIFENTGVEQRHIAADGECVSDMAEKAAVKLFRYMDKSSVDFILLITQCPDYLLPTTACILQDKLGLATTTGALDIGLGCSGYIYGLALAKSLIAGGVAKNVLVFTADLLSKLIHPLDRSAKPLFGDAATVTLISQCDNSIGKFIFGTDGAGMKNLVVPAGGMRLPKSKETSMEHTDEFGSVRCDDNLYMNGPEIFNFTRDVVPKTVEETLKIHNLKPDDVDLFIGHQANAFILDFLRKKMKIPKDKFYINLTNVGNTSSNSIPIALKSAYDEGKIKQGATVMLIGFGVGYSWGATIINY